MPIYLTYHSFRGRIKLMILRRIEPNAENFMLSGQNLAAHTVPVVLPIGYSSTNCWSVDFDSMDLALNGRFQLGTFPSNGSCSLIDVNVEWRHGDVLMIRPHGCHLASKKDKKSITCAPAKTNALIWSFQVRCQKSSWRILRTWRRNPRKIVEKQKTLDNSSNIPTWRPRQYKNIPFAT